MKKFFSLFLLIFCILTLPYKLFPENYLLNGGQKSTINYRLYQKIIPTTETITLNLSYVLPESFQSETYNQLISNLNIRFTREPEKKKQWTDEHGNRIVDYTWINPREPFEAEISFEAQNSVALKNVESHAPFPVKNLTGEVIPFLKATRMVPANDITIKELSSDLVSNAKTEFEAIHHILSWVIDHVNYVLDPEDYGALYSMTTGKGNCQNFSHLSAALLRAQGIPTRIINGITLKEPYDIAVDNNIMTMNMAQGRHSWIEIYFSDLGWMPFDPQQSELFVSNRFIRIEVGIDNEETMNDGLVKWTRTKGSKEAISFQEGIEAAFERDDISIKGNKQLSGPRKLLLMPQVDITLKIPEPLLAKKPEEFDHATLAHLKFETPFIYGNLEFPQNVNFAFTRESTQGTDEDSEELKKNFMVETAEYVSGNEDYAQLFILEKPIILEKIGLALQKFGGRGNLVLELREDQNGKPGQVAGLSNPLDIQSFEQGRGYNWIDFDFSKQGLVLTPDKYWMTIQFNGSPIINWFYSYGKPVGPIDGTQMKLKNEKNWTHTLGYEFNYRVVGKTTQ